LLDAYVLEGLEAGRYDFDMGSKLAAHLSNAGFQLETTCTLPDRELSFAGPAEPEVLQAWTERLARMHLLQQRAQQSYPLLQEEFLRCLASPSHATACRVHFCVARRT
jgi:hypothetical protein